MLTVKLNAKKKSKNQQITPLEKICITFKKNQKNNYFLRYFIVNWKKNPSQWINLKAFNMQIVYETRKLRYKWESKSAA